MTRSIRKVMAALSLSAALLTVPAIAQGPNYSGSWNTQSAAINGRGGGAIRMSAQHRSNAVTFTYGQNTMVCTLTGPRCTGTWQGRTGSGWFDITFASDGRTFAGSWGYDNDRNNVGTFSGQR